jgi:hypothetical protein
VEEASGAPGGNRVSEAVDGVDEQDRMRTCCCARGSFARGLTIPELQTRPASRTERVGALMQTGTTTLAFRF